MIPKEIVALDVGARRIGVARGNLAARIPEPLPVIDRKEYDSVAKIAEKLKTFEPEVLVIGLPKNMQNEQTQQTQQTQEFSESIAELMNQPIVLINEALSTIESAKWQAKYPDADEDSLAACIILERYFEGQTN